MPSKRTIPRVCEVCGTEFLAYAWQVNLGYSTRCSRACWRTIFGTREERLWAKVDKDGPIPQHAPELGPCWVWIASRDSKNYGQIGELGRMYRAHRVSYELAHGVTLAPHQKVMHRCDNPPCVRPEHLKLGSQADNLADMKAKGRHWLQLNPGDSPMKRNQRYRQRLQAAPESLASGHETERLPA
jgi:hypothetical protein